MNFHHVSVLLEETMTGLNLKPGGVYVDCTVGGAGHSAEILRRTGPDSYLVGLDQDPLALAVAKERLAQFGQRVALVAANFKELTAVLQELNINQVDGVLYDLGVSSPQLDNPQRGFSYMHNAPLDMRMNPHQATSAKELVNSLSSGELTDIIKNYGEERWAQRIAQFIIAARKNKEISTTFDLVEIIKKAIPAGARRSGPHPAKRTFQALRIAVNDELNILRQAFAQGVQGLSPGGRLCVISFHSLEDRIAKEYFRYLALDCECPPEMPVCRCSKKQEIKLITRKPIKPSKLELAQNPRARSAKLRVIEKLP